MAEKLIPATLLAGGSAEQREAWILRDLQNGSGPNQSAALLLEGLPSGRTGLDDLPLLDIRRSAPGCLCCAGNLVMRVNLNRVLRQSPDRLYIGVAPGTHLDALVTMLTTPPYSAWLQLQQTLTL